jgi:magnesium transporter
MAEDIHVAQTADASGLADLPMRDEDGEIRPQFVEEISRAAYAADTASLRAVVTELHEAYRGDLIAALAPTTVSAWWNRRRGFRLLGAERSRDDTVGEEILRGLEPQTVAGC